MNAAAAYPEFVRNLGPLADNITSSAWWHPSVNDADKFLVRQFGAVHRRF